MCQIKSNVHYEVSFRVVRNVELLNYSIVCRIFDTRMDLYVNEVDLKFNYEI